MQRYWRSGTVLDSEKEISGMVRIVRIAGTARPMEAQDKEGSISELPTGSGGSIDQG